MSETTLATEELKKALAEEEGGKRWVRRLAWALLSALIIGAGLLWRMTHRPPPPPRYVHQISSAGDIAEKVQATGTVQPVLQVNVGAQVNGRVTRVLVDFNSVVKKGEVLAEIDPSIYDTQASAQQAQLTAQRAQAAGAKAQVLQVKAQMEAARAQFARVEKLREQNLASQADLDAARGQAEATAAQYEAIQASARAAEAATFASAAQLKQSLTNVGFTRLYSPVDGVVVNRAIEPGQTVVASFQAPVLFVIAQDFRKMRVLADVDEADVGKVKEQMEVEAVVDAFVGETFHGVVQQLRYSPNNVQGVVTYSAVVEVDNPEEKLRPGMTATITVKTKEAKGVHRVPNAALRYKPTPPQGPDGKPLAQPPEPPLPKGQARVFVLTQDKPGSEKAEPRVVGVGITDGMFTEVIDLPMGTKVVTDENDVDEKKKKGKMF